MSDDPEQEYFAGGLTEDIITARRALAECKRLQPSLAVERVETYHPITRAEDRARYIDGLKAAGLT